MKNKRILIVPALLLALAVALFSWSAMNAQEGEESEQRLMIKPENEQALQEIKQNKNIDIKHEFDDVITADVPESEISELEQIAEVEDVVVLEIQGELDEPVAEPAVLQRVLVESTEAERTCFPADQYPYNVVQVNGGQLGSGEDIDVAVLDTGAFIDHLDLDIHVCKDFTQEGNPDTCEDTIWHGTHTAGTVGANGGEDGLGIFGVAPNARLWALKVCYSTSCNDDDVAEAIRYAGQNGVEIISMSLSGVDPTPLIYEAMLEYPDMLYVTSAGNTGPEPDTINYPAAYPEVVGIAANDVDKVITSFSARGIDDGNDEVISEREVELTAGGRSVPSTFLNGCYANASGTSMSTPTVAGLAARVWRGNAPDTRDYLRTLIEDITEASGGGAEIGYDIASGYGLPVSPDVLPPIIDPSCDSPDWRKWKLYRKGDRVSYNGFSWEAKRVNIRREPGTSDRYWQFVAPCEGQDQEYYCYSPEWKNSLIYRKHSIVTHDDSAWKAIRFSRKKEPGNSPRHWEFLSECN